MYKLLLKKSFFDGWDNILVLFLNNIIFTALIFGFVYFNSVQSYMIYLILLGFSVHFCGVSGAAYNITRCEGSWFKGYLDGIKRVPHLIVFYIVFVICFLAIFSITPMYMAMGDILWYSMAFFMFFAALITVLALFYFFPLSLSLPKDNPFKTLKKCYIVFFDNFLFSIYCVLKNICDLTVSVFTAMLMPGFAGVAVTQNNAVLFFMMRYDWMEEKKVGKHNVSADQYLGPLIENLSSRNLRTLMFPWKH